jgi:hypothetical protein
VAPKGLRPFYPVTCHPTFSRRQLLAGGGALLAATGLGLGRGGAAQALDDGAAIIRRHASAPEDPWAVCHGVRGMGREFTIRGGRRAVDYLLEDKLATVSANGKSVLAFPIEVEVHPNMFLKTMLEAGVPLDYSFTHGGRRRTLREVVDGAHALLRPSQVVDSANSLPWSIIALTRTTTPLQRKWTNAWGEPVDLDAVVESGVRFLEEASLPLAQAMREGRPETTQAPVHSFTCGGTHLIYALLYAVKAGYVGNDRAERMQRQADLLIWRLTADIDFIERFYRARTGNPGAAWYELDSKLKLLGHGQECLAFASLRDVVKLTPAQKAQHQAAVVTLRRILRDLDARNLEEVDGLDHRLYQQIIGDTCHAHRGLTLA